MQKLNRSKKSLTLIGTMIVLIIMVVAIIFATNTFAASPVSYKIDNDWSSGAVVNVTINNEESTTINGWTLSWDFPNNQTITNMWNATFVQNGSSVTCTNKVWNPNISSGQSVTFGFQLAYSGTNNIPNNIKLNKSSTTTTPVTTAISTTAVPKTKVPTSNTPTTTETKTTAPKTESPTVENPSNLSGLPDLSMNPTVSQLKAWVSKTYDMFPQFKQMYESDLGMTKNEALAFHFADMSRESGKDGYWQMNLETGIGGPGHAWGPFQAAVTNFTNGGYDHDILNSLSMPTPDMSQFKIPKISTYAGMKRLAEGIEKSKTTLGSNRSTVDYLLGTLAHHNTGHATIETITNQGWLQSYGNETLRMMQGYIVGNHLTDNKAYWTTEPIPNVNGPWSGGNK